MLFPRGHGGERLEDEEGEEDGKGGRSYLSAIVAGSESACEAPTKTKPVASGAGAHNLGFGMAMGGKAREGMAGGGRAGSVVPGGRGQPASQPASSVRSLVP